MLAAERGRNSRLRLRTFMVRWPGAIPMIMPQPFEAVTKRDLIASVAYALWQDRKRRNLPDDPDADWFDAEELIADLWNHRPQTNGEPE